MCVCVSAACVRVWFIVFCAYHYVHVCVCVRVWFIVLSAYHLCMRVCMCVCVRASMVYSGYHYVYVCVCACECGL